MKLAWPTMASFDEIDSQFASFKHMIWPLNPPVLFYCHEARMI